MAAEDFLELCLLLFPLSSPSSKRPNDGQAVFESWFELAVLIDR